MKTRNSLRGYILSALIFAFLIIIVIATTPARAECLDRWPCESSWEAPKAPAHKQQFHVKRPMTLGYGVHPKLISAYRYVGSRCKGTRIVSGVRKTRVRGYRRYRRSLHWTGNALDFRSSSYKCAYAALASYGWKSGWSRDGVRCRHIHISYGGKKSEPSGFRHRRC